MNPWTYPAYGPSHRTTVDIPTFIGGSEQNNLGDGQPSPQHKKELNKMSVFNQTTVDTLKELIEFIAQIEEKNVKMHNEFNKIRKNATPDDENYYKSFDDFVDDNRILYDVEMATHCIMSARRYLRDVELEQFSGIANLYNAHKEWITRGE